MVIVIQKRMNKRGLNVKLNDKKIGILFEEDFNEPEIFYYKSRFREEGAELHFLTRLRNNFV